MVEVVSVVELVSAVVVGSLGKPYNIILLYKGKVRKAGSLSNRLGSVRANGVKENIKGSTLGVILILRVYLRSLYMIYLFLAVRLAGSLSG